MSWTVGTFQSQVAQLTGNNNLADLTLGWFNRVLMELSIKVFWSKQTYTEDIGGAGTDSLHVTSNWFTNTGWATRNVVNIHHINFGTYNVMVRRAVQDLHARFHGQIASASTGSFEAYAIPEWVSYADGSDLYMVPKLAVYPLYNTLTTSFEASYLSAMDKLDDTADYNWMTDKYGQVVLFGVLRHAMLYLGDLQAYSVYKNLYTTGVKDMIQTEEARVASVPNFRGVLPEKIMRGGIS